MDIKITPEGSELDTNTEYLFIFEDGKEIKGRMCDPYGTFYYWDDNDKLHYINSHNLIEIRTRNYWYQSELPFGEKVNG